MNSVSFEGFNAKYLTFKKADDATLKKGDFVSISSDCSVTNGKADEDIVGMCVDVRDDLVTVQVSGYMTAPVATGQKITYGYSKLTLNEDGKIKASTAVNRSVLVVEVINLSTVGFIL